MADPKIKGIMQLTSDSGQAPVNYSFYDVTWTGFDGGSLLLPDGSRVAFAKTDVRKIIYFDPNYYNELAQDTTTMPFRAAMRAREVVVPTVFTNILNSDDLQSVQAGKEALERLESDNLAIPQAGSSAGATEKLNLAPYIAVLNDDIAKFNQGMRLMNGQWMSQADMVKNETLPSDEGKPISFTTVSGVKYINAQVTASDDGLQIVTAEGGTSLPFSEIPDDVSPFYKSLRTVVLTRRLSDFKNASLNDGSLPAYFSKASSLYNQTSDLAGLRHDLIESLLAKLSAYISEANFDSILTAWTDFKKSVQLPAGVEFDFWEHFLHQDILNLDQDGRLVDLIGSIASTPEEQEHAAEWKKDFATVRERAASLEKSLMDFLDDKANASLAENHASKDALGQTFDLKPISDLNFDDPLPAGVHFEAITHLFSDYKNCALVLDNVQSLRKKLAAGELADASTLVETIKCLQIDYSSPAQKKIQAISEMNLGFYQSQKDTSDQLVRDADNLVETGGSSVKALDLYRRAYELNKDDEITKKIAKLNKESLGI